MPEWSQQPGPEEDDTPVTRAEYEALVRVVESFVATEGATEEISVAENARINNIGLFVNVAHMYGQSCEETEKLDQDRMTLYFRLTSADGESASITIAAGEDRDTEVTIFSHHREKITGLAREAKIIAAKAGADLARCLVINRNGSDYDTPVDRAYLDTAYGAISTILKINPTAYADMIMGDPSFNDTRIVSWETSVKRLASELSTELRKQKAGYFTSTKTLQVEEGPNTQIEFISITNTNYDADLNPTITKERRVNLNAFYKSLRDGLASVIEESVSLCLYESTAKIEKKTVDITDLGYQDLAYSDIALPERGYPSGDLDDFFVPERDPDLLEIGLFTSKIAFARAKVKMA